MSLTVQDEERHLSETGQVMSGLLQIAADPSIDIARVKELREMHREMRAERAAEAFAAALSDLQADLPAVIEYGKTDKAKYARWEDVVETVKPHMARHGFSISFEIDQEPNAIIVTGVLRHREGHKERAPLRLPIDAGPGRNAVQAIGSSVSYGKRYTAAALLNVTTRNEDDDGRRAVNSAPAPDLLTESQVLYLRDMLASVGAEEAAFCRAVKVAALGDIRANQYEDAVALIKRKGQQR